MVAHGLAAEEFRRYRLFGYRMLDFSLVFEIPRAPVFAVSVFYPQTREERGHSVEIVLREVLQRVIVALGAFQPDAEKKSGHRGRRLGDFELLLHEVRRGRPERARGREKSIAFTG